MVKREFQIPLYNVDVTLIQVEKVEDAESVEKIMLDFGCEKEHIQYTVEGIRREAVNGGDTFRELTKNKILVIFYDMENDMKASEIYSHEKRHIEDRILKYFDVDDIESAGLLAGFLGGKFYEFFNLSWATRPK